MIRGYAYKFECSCGYSTTVGVQYTFTGGLETKPPVIICPQCNEDIEYTTVKEV